MTGPTEGELAAAAARARDTPEQRAATRRLKAFRRRIDAIVPRLPAPHPGRPMCHAWTDHHQR